jgi:lipopolysaccharide/colanic/teichoic acid biosynthesis glycosyltransferase
MIRFFDFLFAILGLIILSPLFLIVAIWIKLDSSGPVFYKQKRVGRNNKDFKLLKFRSMVTDADTKGLITVGGRDPRVTQSGYFIRKYKLDELPQLLNVLIGDMSLVGPRPEVRKYVDLYNETQRKVLSVKPGITDYASIEYIDENEILGKAENPEKVYIEQIMPEKIKYNMKYIQNRSVKEYFKIIFLTIGKIVK